MSDSTPGGEPLDPDVPDRDMLAAEYVLGLLDTEQRRAVARAAVYDPDMASAVADWSARLEPLASQVRSEPPSEFLWHRIARDLPSGVGTAARPASSASGGLIWRMLALGGCGLAAGLGVALLLSGHRVEIHVAWTPNPTASLLAPLPTRPAGPSAPKPPPPPAPRPLVALPRPAPPVPTSPIVPPASHNTAVALLTAAGGDQPAMKAFFVQGGTVRLVPMQPVRIPPGKALGFWVWPRGTALPIPLGHVDAAGGTLRFPYQEADGTPVMVTLEPSQLPLSDAQGPTLFTGQLVAVD